MSKGQNWIPAGIKPYYLSNKGDPKTPKPYYLIRRRTYLLSANECGRTQLTFFEWRGLRSFLLTTTGCAVQ